MLLMYPLTIVICVVIFHLLVYWSSRNSLNRKHGDSQYGFINFITAYANNVYFLYFFFYLINKNNICVDSLLLSILVQLISSCEQDQIQHVGVVLDTMKTSKHAWLSVMFESRALLNNNINLCTTYLIIKLTFKTRG